MSTVGYSGKPLAEKLGARPGARWLAIDPPADYRALLAPLPQGLSIAQSATKGEVFELIHLFAPRRAALALGLAPALGFLAPGGALWVSWPKKTAPQFIDLTEDGVRAEAFPLGLVDVKVCAVDACWSGLKLVRRKQRETKP